MPFARVHSVVIFAEPVSDKYKASFHFYYVTKKNKARDKFQREYPNRKILRVLDLGVSEVEFAEDKYHELYKDD